MPYLIDDRVAIVEAYVDSGYFQEMHQIFADKFLNAIVSAELLNSVRDIP